MRKSRSKFTVYLGTIGAMFFWGISFVWTKIVFEYYGPFTTVLLRLIISSALLTVYAKVSGTGEKIERRDWPLFLLLSFLEPFCYFLGESFGLMRVSSTLASMMIALIPVLSPVFAYIFHRERLTAINITGLLVSFAGVALFTTTGGTELNASPAGLLLLLFAVLSGIGYSIVVKKLAGRYRPLTIVRIQNMVGGLYFLPFMAAFEWRETLSANPPANVIANLVMLAVFGSSLAFILVTISIRELGIGKTNVFTNIIPIITAISAYFLLGEEFTERKILGMAIVISGIFLAQFRKKVLVVHER